MASDDASPTIRTISKRLITPKDRIRSYNQSRSKSLIDDLPTNRKLIAPSGLPPRLPKLVEKATICLSTPDVLQFRQPHFQEKDAHSSVSSKLEQPSIDMSPPIRLPTFYTLTSEIDQKQMVEFRRRQIYALNHLMRGLEQEQFREFCELHGIGTG